MGLKKQRKFTGLRGLLKLTGFIKFLWKIIKAVMILPENGLSDMQSYPQVVHRAAGMQLSRIIIHASVGL